MNSNATFMTVTAFKLEVDTKDLKVMSNTKDGKTTKFVVTDNGATFKAQATLDTNKPMKFIIGEGKTIEDACLANVKEGSAKTLATL